MAVGYWDLNEEEPKAEGSRQTREMNQKFWDLSLREIVLMALLATEKLKKQNKVHLFFDC